MALFNQRTCESACFFGVCAAITASICGACLYSLESSGDEGVCKKYIKLSAIATAIFVFFVIFIPGKATMIEMAVLRCVTAENINAAMDVIKSTTDYIVSAID